MNTRWFLKVRSSVVLSVVCCVLGADVHAQVPALIRFQGQAVDSQGVPLEGPYTLTFRLYDAATAGTKLWEEPQAVTLSKGHFSVLLGQGTPLTGMSWSQPCWLSIQVGAQAELAPRQQFTAVPIALRADTAEQVANISARVRHSANVSLAHDTWTTIPFDTEADGLTFDTDNTHSLTANTGRLTIQTPGKYLIYALVVFDAHPTGIRGARIMLNDVTNLVQTSLPGSSWGIDGNCLSIMTYFTLRAGEFLTVQAYQNSGGALNTRAFGISPVFGILKIQ